MRVSSISSNSVRVVPRQERSTRRLAGFLDAAATLFAELGYEATTMQAIADRSDSSIGALYNYFPDKQSVANTLLRQYAGEVRASMKVTMEESMDLPADRFAGRFIDLMLDSMRQYPAYLSLLAAPVRFSRDQAARRALRSDIAAAFRAKNPLLSPERALLAANVALQIVKGLKALYLESGPKSRAQIAAESRKVLAFYLESILSEKA